MSEEHTKKTASSPLSKGQKEELASIATLTDQRIDTDEVPEVRDWSGARRGVFYRPVKEQLTLRLDADVVDWFKAGGKGYQTRINKALRAYVEDQERKVG